MRDPYLCTVPEAARLFGRDRQTFASAVREGKFGDVESGYPSAHRELNLIALCRAIFKDDAERVLPELKERLAAMRSSKVKVSA